MGTDTETTNVGVLLKGDKNMEGPDGKAGEKAESNIEQTKEGTNKSKMNNKTETEEATSMGADTEAIGSGAQSDLLNYVVGFHTKGAVASKSMEKEAKMSEMMRVVIRKKRIVKKRTVKKRIMMQPRPTTYCVVPEIYANNKRAILLLGKVTSVQFARGVCTVSCVLMER